MANDLKLCACPRATGRSCLHYRRPSCEDGRVTGRGWAPAPRHLNLTIDLKPLAEQANRILTALASETSRIGAAIKQAREAQR
ncbi:hypothetical protein [Actinomadura bangladeshensis]|uniref:Uncharacterized protein n=1 Tax=Actinomadura bangladeshensis TaxID=453573 RepID=A0A6L9QAQ4_9ACTN|nr:hypothetical protein [Actinomadura bangladeshensis]NEA21600.1 hypothetical protein [Actinomadura bangladeshensis]NEA22560.1 hypothetical protein [Actinomadura bangladeshensis]